MDEFELINLLTRDLPQTDSVKVGPGDDCAVLDLGLEDRYLLFKTDAVVEGVHFTAEDPPEQIGYKAMARCLSDVAAMAGHPTHALITLALPQEFDPARIEGVYQGLKIAGAPWQVSIVGGETTTNPDRLLLSIALLGTVLKSQCVRRAGARSGDALFVTGELGGSRTGKHLDFRPRLDEARWLAENFPPHAMIDLSDGLAGDLRHLLKASACGAELHARSIPISRAARLLPRTDASAKPPLLAALSDGEDFELLFTLARTKAVALLDAWKKRFPEIRLTCIGKITDTPGLILRDKDGARPLTLHGYTHFKKS
jgi:thiamine-monophosphate kinase